MTGRIKNIKTVLIFTVPVCVFFSACSLDDNKYRTWEVYKGDKGSTGYSELDQINRSNVDQLEVAWTYHSGFESNSGSETNPIIIDGIMYVVTPKLKVAALDATRGKEIWFFDPFKGDKEKGESGVNRAVTYWEDGNDKRIFITPGHKLYALDAKSGTPVFDFGNDGTVDLRKGIMGRDPDSISVQASSPGIIFKNLLIIGSTVDTGTPGDVRAFNVRTGEIAWVFHTIPRPGEYGHDTWGEEAWKKAGGANNWGGMSLDEEREIVYMGTATGNPDFYTPGTRGEGKHLFANSVLALDANTGERIWHYQTIHHDLWDYDLPAPPVLVTKQNDGRQVDAVAQVTKQGFTFVLDRETGTPLFPVEERPMPQSDIEGEQSWPTQPIPLLPEPFTRQHITEDDLTNISQEAYAYALTRFRELKYEGLYTPPGEQETLRYPSTQGGANWGGASFDPETNMLYVNANEYGNTISLSRQEGSSVQSENAVVRGQNLVQTNCTQCHGTIGKQTPSEFPSLVNLDQKFSKYQIKEIIQSGRGRMPAFASLSEEETQSIVEFLYNVDEQGAIDVPDTVALDDSAVAPEAHNIEAKDKDKYTVDFAYRHFLDQDGYFATKPPWGTLNAINLNTGKIEWKVPLGEYEELTQKGIPITGTKNYGGSIVTAGGLVFIAGTSDKKIRAFDKNTGEVLWVHDLPAAGGAAPSTYQIDGRQYIVIAATGGRVEEAAVPYETGDAFIAFSLPEK